MPRVRARLAHFLGTQTIPRRRHGETHNQVSSHNVGYQSLIVRDPAMGPERAVLQGVDPGIYGASHAFHPVHVDGNFTPHAMRVLCHHLKPRGIIL
jgi:hypothetical protein